MSAFNVLLTTAAELQQRLSDGSLTSVDIIQTYLRQIEKHDRAGAKLNAILSLAPRESLLKQAKRLDEERNEGKIRGDLHGLPIVVKDCFQFDPALGLQTTGGAACFVGEKARKNALVIEQEFCGHRTKDPLPPGYSAYGGQTRSAYDTSPPDDNSPKQGLDTLCGGSSSGSGVAVSAGFVPLSLGTETGGSTVFPASKAGLYAMKPSYGSVAADGVFRISRSFDGVGAMAKTAVDLAVLVESILAEEARTRIPDGGYRSVMNGSWEGVKVGILGLGWGRKELGKWGSPDVKKKYASVADKILEGGGHAVYEVEAPEASTLKHNDITFRDIAYYEFSACSREFCSGFSNPKVHNLAELIDWNKAHQDVAMPKPYDNQGALIESFESTLTDEMAREAYLGIKRLAGEEGMDKVMRENDLDLMVVDSESSLPSFCACAAYPSATVPLGNFEDGQPRGLFVLAKAGREDAIFRFMSAFEKTFPKIKPPNLS